MRLTKPSGTGVRTAIDTFWKPAGFAYGDSRYPGVTNCVPARTGKTIPHTLATTAVVYTIRTRSSHRHALGADKRSGSSPYCMNIMTRMGMGMGMADRHEIKLSPC